MGTCRPSLLYLLSSSAVQACLSFCSPAECGLRIDKRGGAIFTLLLTILRTKRVVRADKRLPPQKCGLRRETASIQFEVLSPT
jgi:hypothetical protein